MLPLGHVLGAETHGHLWPVLAAMAERHLLFFSAVSSVGMSRCARVSALCPALPCPYCWTHPWHAERRRVHSHVCIAVWEESAWRAARATCRGCHKRNLGHTAQGMKTGTFQAAAPPCHG